MDASGHPVILVVDDDRSVRILMQAFLAQGGFASLPAADGAEGLSVFKARRGEIDLLLTDVVMPEMNGVDLARQARDLSPSLPIVFVSTDLSPWLEFCPADCLFVQKPFDLRALNSAVQRGLGPRLDRSRETFPAWR